MFTVELRDGLLHCSGTDTQALLGFREDGETLIIAFRGPESGSMADVMTDLKISSVRWFPPAAPGGLFSHFKRYRGSAGWSAGFVHGGIMDAFKAVEGALSDAMEQIMKEGTVKRVLCTGHSLGGGLATMCALWISERYPYPKLSSVEVYTYGGAVVGDEEWKDHFESLVPGCYRLVNDKDVVPTFTGMGRYVQVGWEMKMNEIGLWMNPSNFVNDCEGGLFEHIDDHKVSNYRRLLNFYTAMTTQPEVTVRSLVKTWRAYNAGASELQVRRVREFQDDERVHDLQWEIATEQVPNLRRMQNTIQECFGAEQEQVAKLIHVEVARLCKLYGKKSFGFPVFALACIRLVCADDRDREVHREWARCYQEFITHDHDGDGFLSEEEFAELLADILKDGNNHDEVDASASKVREQLMQIDIDLDNHVSFVEYFVWRALANENDNDQRLIDSVGFSERLS
jgi:hypothetical protein